MWQPVMEDSDWDSDPSLSFVSGWGPYLVISGWILTVAAPTIMLVGARHVARVHGDLAWIAFVLLCLVGTLSGMTLLVHNHRLRRRYDSTPTQADIPSVDRRLGFGLLGSLALLSVVVFVMRWLG